MRANLRRGWCMAIAAMAALAAGCDDGEAVPARVTHCKTVCAQRDMCIRDTDLADCEARCQDQEFRSDLYYQVKASCVTSTLSCDEWAEELDERGEDLCTDEDDCALAACVHGELARKNVSADQEQYCRRLSNMLAACEDLDADAIALTCEDRLLEVSSQYANETESCVLDSGCSGIAHCLDELAETYGTDLKVFPQL